RTSSRPTRPDWLRGWAARSSSTARATTRPSAWPTATTKPWNTRRGDSSPATPDVGSHHVVGRRGSMDLGSSAEHLAAALVQSAAREKGQAAARPGFTIALSREVGARGTSVARALGARLGWAVYDNEILERIAQEMKVRPRVLQRVDERHASLLNEFIESFGSGPSVSEGAYVRHLSATLR